MEKNRTSKTCERYLVGGFMVKRMKTIFFINILVCFLLFNICYVSAYDFMDPDNKYDAERDRRAIYDLVDLYYDIVGQNRSQFNILNYSGACSVVTVEGMGSYPLEEYVAGVVKHEVGSESDNPELLKAQAVAARSFVINTQGNSSGCTISNSEKTQTFAEVDANDATDQKYIQAAIETAGMVVSRDGKVALTQYLSYPNAIFYQDLPGKWTVNFQKYAGEPSTAWTWTGPDKDEVINANNYKPRSGAPSTTHHFGMSQIIAGYMTRNGATYQEVIDTFYGGVPGYSLSVLSDGTYVGPLEYVDSEFGQIRYWNQGDFKDYYYSSDVSVPKYTGSKGTSATIASHGCGPTSLAIIFSSFAGRDISPITTTQQLCSIGGCSGGGSYFYKLQELAEQYGYKTEVVNKSGDVKKVVNALSSGNSLVIGHMGPGVFTTGGHYIVLTGTRSDGSVSVADPGSRSRTEKKWFSFNLVVEQTKSTAFIIITK